MQQRGIALLLVLSTVFLISIMLSTTYFYLSDAILVGEKSKRRQFEKQLLLGAESILLNFILKKSSTKEYSIDLAELLLNPLNIIRLDDQEISYRLIDMTNCFNVNTLNYYSDSIDNNVLYPWLVLRNILQLNKITSSELNEIIEKLNNHLPANPSLMSIEYDHNYMGDSLQLSNSINKLLNINDVDFLKIAPLFCSRQDNTLLININMLEFTHGKLVQAVLMNTINESDTSKLILSKPDKGWETVELFFNFIVKKSAVDINKVNLLLENRMLNFSHDEFYFMSTFKLVKEDGNYQLISFFHGKGKNITVLRRRLISNE
ncbi:general secretion pathway protein GspK [Yersinia hibernica]|nr:type II secretion system protein GspK [Yersinia hibernica]